MKRLSKIIITLFLIIIVVMTMFFLKSDKEQILENKSPEKQLNNIISMMVEQSDGTYKANINKEFVSDGYIFNPSKSGCENGGSLFWNREKGKVEATLLTSDKCYAYFDIYSFTRYCEYSQDDSLVCEVINKKDNTLIYHDGSVKDSNGNVTDASDYSYRFAGTSNDVNNFVCLDGGVTTKGQCANGDADLYRIIGLFKNPQGDYEAKLIKYDYATGEQLGTTGAYKDVYDDIADYYKGDAANLATIGGYYWTSSSNALNEWSDSELRKTNLNDYYLNTYLKENKGINTAKIALHTWSINGHSSTTISPRIMFDNEMGNVDSSPASPTVTPKIDDKIGLMYASDYGYAVSPAYTNNWTTALYRYNDNDIMDNDWMFMGLYDWTISRYSNHTRNAIYVNGNGYLSSHNVLSYALGVRPAFYLLTDTLVKSGDGSKNSPYRLVI